MVSLIPAVKEMKLTGGILTKKAISFDKNICSARLAKALEKLPVSSDGATLSVSFGEGAGEGYSLTVSADSVAINADSEKGAFWAVQTLRQLFVADEIPCLVINDKPDFAYRGFYHDVTRGKVASIATIKKLIDTMAYYKMNALQLYVEHVFDFEETRDIIGATSYYTGAEMRELDEYCKENFIDFQPSLSTFGHMFEILDQEKYRHLRVLNGYENHPCRWYDRMAHHTIDPKQEESIELVKSLIDQFAPHFSDEYFNICCDETFDLKKTYPAEIEGKLYIDFVKAIISHVQSKGKKVMMWADILLQHPEYISELPEDVCFLNWKYAANPPESNIAEFAKLGRTQIVCPGTTSWSRFCERVDQEESNISKMAEYGKKYGALGMLNTNWGDYGNPASIEMASYGLVLGAAKSWFVETEINDAFYADVNNLLYGNANGMKILRAISDIHNGVKWNPIFISVHSRRAGVTYAPVMFGEDLRAAQKGYRELIPLIEAGEWNDDFKEEMYLAVEGVCVLAELAVKHMGFEFERVTDTKKFIEKYKAKWLEKNKPSEISRIEDAFLYADSL